MPGWSGYIRGSIAAICCGDQSWRSRSVTTCHRRGSASRRFSRSPGPRGSPLLCAVGPVAVPVGRPAAAAAGCAAAVKLGPYHHVVVAAPTPGRSSTPTGPTRPPICRCVMPCTKQFSITRRSATRQAVFPGIADLHRSRSPDPLHHGALDQLQPPMETTGGRCRRVPVGSNTCSTWRCVSVTGWPAWWTGWTRTRSAGRRRVSCGPRWIGWSGWPRPVRRCWPGGSPTPTCRAGPGQDRGRGAGPPGRYFCGGGPGRDRGLESTR